MNNLKKTLIIGTVAGALIFGSSLSTGSSDLGDERMATTTDKVTEQQIAQIIVPVNTRDTTQVDTSKYSNTRQTTSFKGDYKIITLYGIEK